MTIEHRHFALGDDCCALAIDIEADGLSAHDVEGKMVPFAGLRHFAGCQGK